MMRKKKLLFMLTLLCAIAQGAWAQNYDVWDGVTKTRPQFYGNYDGHSNIIVINTAAEMAYVNENWDEPSGFVDGKDFYELDYYLNHDIDMDPNVDCYWKPLAGYKNTFYGNGHTIKIHISNRTANFQGLFERIYKDGKVQDLHVTGEMIVGNSDRVGGIAGLCEGTIQNCRSSLYIECGGYDQTTNSERVGGITGSCEEGTIENCEMSGNMNMYASEEEVGGIVGYIYQGIVKGCRMSGNIKCRKACFVGGIAGDNNWSTIQNCWTSGDVSSENTADGKIGGIAGTNQDIFNRALITFCCVTGNVTCNGPDVGGIVGNNFCPVSHCTFYGTVNSTHEQDTKYVGNTDDDESDLYDTFNQSEYDAASGNDLYRHAIKYPYAISVVTEGPGAIVVSAGGEVNEPGASRGQTITVTATSGYRVRNVDVKDSYGNPVHFYGIKHGYAFTMPGRDVVITAYTYNDWPTQGAGTEESPYMISNSDEWDSFAWNVAAGDMYTGKYVKLTQNINVTTMVGHPDMYPFKGTFDGGGHTVTVNYNTTEQYAAPFRWINDVSIKNLHIAGSITTGGEYAGGFVGRSWGTLNITNCRSSVTIKSNKAGENYHGGFVGDMDEYYSTVEITGCVFDGAFAKTAGATSCGGFIGFADYNKPTISNSLMKPSSVAADMLSNTFANYTDNHVEPTITNSYSTATANLPNTQGKRAYTVSAGQYVTIESALPYGVMGDWGLVYYNADPPIYDCSDIAVYFQGLVCNGTTYCGNGDILQLKLTNSAPAPGVGKQYLYTASAGTLEGNRLTMPDCDVTIAIDINNPVGINWMDQYSGTADDPYLIYSKDQFDLLSQEVNEGSHFENKYFKLMNDIEYSHTTEWNDPTSTENNFTSIRTALGFCGDFDGNGHTISGIRIYQVSNDESTKQGLFGSTGNGANIHDLTLADTRITACGRTGGIVGWHSAEAESAIVSNCHVAANVAIHAVTGGGYFNNSIGGIVGTNTDNGVVRNCTSAATITTDGNEAIQNIGAIAGENVASILTDNFAIGATVPAVKNNTHGAICGKNFGSVTFQRNYYIGCTVAGTPDATDVGCQAADVTTDNGAVGLHSITEGDKYIAVENAGSFVNAVNGVTIYDAGFMYDGKLYAAAGETVNLTISHSREGFTPTYRASAGTLTGTANAYTLTMPGSNVTIDVSAWRLENLTGEGTKGNPYKITSTADWNALADYIAGGYGLKDEFVKLTNDISVETMVGTDGNHIFRGIFDGGGHTLTVSIGTEGAPFAEEFCGPFRYTYGATIKNLHTEGHIYTSSLHAGGVVGRNGTNRITLEGVTSSVAIHSSYNGDQGAYHGGLVGYAINASFAGCAFTGSLLGTDSHHCGGLLGQKSATNGSNASFTHCLFAPAEVTVSTKFSYTFAAATPGLTTYDGSYYTQVLGSAQGTQGFPATVEPTNLGVLVQDYGMVKAYGNGILYDGTYYVAPATISLADNADNSTTIGNADGYVANVTLQDRTLYKDGSWNTLCLPFSLTGLEGSPLEGATVKTLASTSFEGGTLTMNFTEDVTSIEAGKPYIVKWPEGTDIANPVFKGVIISNTTANAETDCVNFVGTYSPASIYTAEKTNLYLGAGNKLYYPTADDFTVNALRGYFQLKQGLAAGSAGALARITAFNLNFGDDNATGIITTNSTNSDHEWYTLDGRKLDGKKPTQRGIYIYNGKKVAIK